jgi:hypothetical protein
VKVYRIVIDSWPTDDGEPWARYYGDNTAVPNHVIPGWLRPLLEQAVPHMYRYRDGTPLLRVANRLKYDDDREHLAGVIMPLPKRVTYVSASGVKELARDMRAFGAEVRVIASDPITWPKDDA